MVALGAKEERERSEQITPAVTEALGRGAAVRGEEVVLVQVAAVVLVKMRDAA